MNIMESGSVKWRIASFNYMIFKSNGRDDKGL